MKHGQGKKVYNSGEVYTGQFNYDQIEGIGQFCYNDGADYTGEFKGAIMHGKGCMRDPT